MNELQCCPSCGSYSVNMGREQVGLTKFNYVICRRCKMTGPEENGGTGEALSATAAAEAWNSLPRPLRWTTEPPTKPDFYWHRDGGILSIAYVYEGAGTLFCHFAGEEAPTLLDLVTGEWAGPIPEPQEPQE